MRALVVLSKSLAEKMESTEVYYLSVDSLKIPIALIHIPDVEFDENADKNENAVLVRKKGFSLNYRDLGVIENAWYKLEKKGGDSYYPIGSDFCGEVMKVGKNVTNVSIGDYVVSDCSYPIAPFNAYPGIPSNHASKELEILHRGKLRKIPENITVAQAAGMSIGVQTAMSMLRKAAVKKGDNILVTSITSNTSLFILNYLRDKECNVYGISYSNQNIEKVEGEYPFLKKIFKYKEYNIDPTLLFDVVFDPFSDTYLDTLMDNLNLDAKYITCGIFNQSADKIDSDASYQNMTSLIAKLVQRNVSFSGNCLGSSEDFEEGVRILSQQENNKVVVDSVFYENDFIGDFLDKSFNRKSKLGKVIMKY